MKKIRQFALIILAGLFMIGAAVSTAAKANPPLYPSADIPAPAQLPGEHSTLTTHDGSIRDDELADWICSQIPKVGGVPQVKDVKIMFNSCYGGGMLDDIQRVFGPGGACAGVPWVAGAASGPNQVAYGPSNSTVDSHPGENLGSRWTNALDDAIKAGGNVQSSFETAKNNDKAGPNGYHGEDPVVASGNGGSNITWTGATKHRAVVFGGKNNAKRHNNNIENVSDALVDVWPQPPHDWTIILGMGDATTGTEAYLKGAIADAGAMLDSDTQLVLYFDDHGDTDFDIDEFMNWLSPYTFDPTQPTLLNFDLHEGWVEGLQGMEISPLDTPAPYLAISVTEEFIPQEWEILLNGTPLPLPTDPFIGEVQIPVEWPTILPGPNIIEVLPAPTGPTAPFTVDNLELGSGPISELEDIEIFLPLIID